MSPLGIACASRRLRGDKPRGSLRIFAAVAVLAVLGWPASLWGQYSQMGAPTTWGGGGGGGYAGGYGGGYSGYQGGYQGYGGGYAGGYGGGGYGGGYSGMNPATMSLIARQSEQVHGQVADLLDQLRRMQGQQVAISTPFHTVNDDFFERIGVGFGFNINAAPFNPNGGSQVVGLMPNGALNPSGAIQFRQGSVDSALPQFGGHDPASDATVGAAVLGNDASLFFNLIAGQGSSRTHTSQVPTVVLQNGTQGSFLDTSQTPFVTGLIPVVGAGTRLPYYPVPQQTTYYPLHDRIRQYQAQRHKQAEDAAHGLPPANPAAHHSAATGPEPKLSASDELSLKAVESRASTAGHGDLSVAEIKRRRAAQEASEARSEEAEILTLIERGRGAEDAGKANVAVIYYRQAASRAEGDLKRELETKVQELEKN